ncbi:alpha/beta hydrolase [Corynebacterium breve]|uniref:Alpha/beta hydrolase n=1 Tax=Corynebacterium breve TaxID=3049799 RepID=A0ABY8VHV4_9CORY|nr:alpha/beta hydrolase [Corynebacterium breve]WIM67804.1 alpha/beta hydrolase [Corynebacterium breve]
MENQEKLASSSDGTKLAYIEVGTGPALVITHGSLAGKDQWEPAVQELSGDVTCYVYDRRGRGSSGDSPSYSMQTEMDDLAAILQIAGEGATILGHSYGALCVLEYALKSKGHHPIIAFEPPLAVDEPVAGEPWVEYRNAIEAGNNDDALRLGLRSFVRASDAEVEAMANSSSWPSLLEIAPTWVRELREIDALGSGASRYAPLVERSTAVLVGTATSPFLLKSAEALIDAVPSIHPVSMPGLNHFAHVFDPVGFAGHVRHAMGIE